MIRAEAPTRSVADPDADLLDAIVQTSFPRDRHRERGRRRPRALLTQLRVLAILRTHTPTVSELSDYLGLDRSTVSGLIDRAARRGLLVRAVDGADRRAVRVGLTETGRTLAVDGAAEIAEGVAPLVAGLPAADRARLGRLLETTAGRPAG